MRVNEMLIKVAKFLQTQVLKEPDEWNSSWIVKRVTKQGD